MKDGKSLYSDRKGPSGDMSMREDAAEIRNLVLDGQRYHGINEESMPPAWSKVPINIEQDGECVKAEMFAGIMGIGLTSGKTAQSTEGKDSGEGGESAVFDTMSPAAAWWITEAMGPKYEAQKKRKYVPKPDHTSVFSIRFFNSLTSVKKNLQECCRSRDGHLGRWSLWRSITTPLVPSCLP